MEQGFGGHAETDRSAYKPIIGYCTYTKSEIERDRLGPFKVALCLKDAEACFSRSTVNPTRMFAKLSAPVRSNLDLSKFR